ncbi:MAG: GGDEF domain-containing protein [Lysobacterales bacterium]
MSDRGCGVAPHRLLDRLHAPSRIRDFMRMQAIAWAMFLIACASAWAQDDSAELLQQADEVKSAEYDNFAKILERLEKRRAKLSNRQGFHLDYLKGWQFAYVADFDSALATLADVAERAEDGDLRFRAEATASNVLTIMRRYQPALEHLNAMLALLPAVEDPKVRAQGLLTAAQIHSQVGQHDVASEYARQVIRETPTGKVLCQALQIELDARFGSGRVRGDDPDALRGLAACVDSGEVIFANLIRTVIAQVELKEGRVEDAIALLEGQYDEVQRTRYGRLVTDYDALLAQSWWKKGETAKARSFARRAVDGRAGKEITEPVVKAFLVLFQIAKAQGDTSAALAFHEIYAAADKRFLDDIGARELAYQMVKSQATANRLQIEALGKRNQLLQLEQKVSKSAAQTRGLYILLLLSLLGLIAMWAGMTKRSQLHFMKLARRDGLTGIFNRAHFADAAESVLAYCRKGEREACVVLLDLDHFKLVNDTHGHAAGDVVLKRTVQACQSHLRSIDIIGRLGGEEFGIVLPDCSPDHAFALAEQFRLGVADISKADGGVGFPVSASFGVTSSRWSSYNLRQLIIHADKALYVSKNSGRNRVSCFDAAGAKSAAPLADQPGNFDRRVQ